MRRKAPGLGVPDEDAPARPGELKPAAERPSIGVARQREATGHRPSAVLPFAARAPLSRRGGGRWAGNGKEREGELFLPP